jgi:hypothetical protein
MGWWEDLTGQTAAKNASESQEKGAKLAAEVQRETLAQQMKMFNQQQKMLKPFVGMAEGSMGQMGVLSGMEGAQAQQAAISQLESSPLFQSQIQQGEEAMLQNASATGGLRGGNTMAALAQYRPQMLQQEIDRQYDRLGGIANLGMGPLGQASASFGQMAGAQGAAGQNLANIQQQLGQQNAAMDLMPYQMNLNAFLGTLNAGANIVGAF